MATANNTSVLTDKRISEIWESLDGRRIIAGESALNWNAMLRKHFARAIEAEVIDRLAATTQAERANANLYGDIMNLPCNPPDGWSRIQQTAYTIGHRDARHAAAELVSAQDTTTSSTEVG